MSDDQKPLVPGVKTIPVSKLGGLGIGLPDFRGTAAGEVSEAGQAQAMNDNA